MSRYDGDPTLMEWLQLDRTRWLNIMHSMLKRDAERNGDHVRAKFHREKESNTQWILTGRAEEKLWQMGFGNGPHN